MNISFEVTDDDSAPIRIYGPFATRKIARDTAKHYRLESYSIWRTDEGKEDCAKVFVHRSK